MIIGTISLINIAYQLAVSFASEYGIISHFMIVKKAEAKAPAKKVSI